MKKILIATLLLSGNAHAQLGNFTAGNLIVTNNIAASNDISASSYTLNGDTITNWPSGGVDYINKSGNTVTIDGDVRAEGDLNVNGLIETPFFKAGEGNTSRVEPGNWYRIARVSSRGYGDPTNSHNGSAEFVLMNPNRECCTYNTVRFTLGHSYGYAWGSSFTLLEYSRYNQVFFEKVRLTRKSSSGYGHKYVEIYVRNTPQDNWHADGMREVSYALQGNIQKSGWEPIDWEPTTLPSDWMVMAEYDLDAIFSTGDTQNRLTVKRGGNIGIGTTSPEANLHISAPNAALKFTDTSSGGDDYAFINNVWGGANFMIYNTTDAKAEMSFIGNGNVGIGENSPQAKLHVDGNIIADDPEEDNHVVTKGYLSNSVSTATQTLNMNTNAITFEVPSTNSFRVSGTISPAADGCYVLAGQMDGYPYYVREDGQFSVHRDPGTGWHLSEIDYLGGDGDTPGWESYGNNPWDEYYEGRRFESPGTGSFVSLNTCGTETRTFSGQDFANFATKKYVDNAITNNSDSYIGSPGTHVAGGNLNMKARSLFIGDPELGPFSSLSANNNGFVLTSEESTSIQGFEGISEVLLGDAHIDINAFDINVNGQAVFNDLVNLKDFVKDQSGSDGSPGQVLSATGSGVKWVDPESGNDSDWTEAGGNVVRTNGNVGINTDNPESALHIYEHYSGFGPSEHTVILDAPENKSPNILFKADGQTKANIRVADFNKDQLQLMVGTPPTAAVNITTNQKVGIGTSEPKASLHVWDEENSGYPIAIQPGNWATLGFNSYTDEVVKYAKDGYAGYLTFAPDGSFRFWTAIEGLADTDANIHGRTRLLIKNDGNIGIGEPNPQTKLHVSGNIIANDPTNNNHVATKEYVDNQTANLSASSVTSAVNDVYVNKSGDNVTGELTVQGNIGIGTETPEANLHVSAPNAALKLTDTSNGGDEYAFINNVWGGANLMIYNTTDSKAEMSFIGNGNVGIGTTSPEAKLHVTDPGVPVNQNKSFVMLGSNLKEQHKTEYPGAPMLTLYDHYGPAYLKVQKDDHRGTGWGFNFLGINGVDNNGNAYSQNRGIISFSAGTNGYSLVMRGDNGNVGVGTHNPQTKLHVTGDALIKGPLKVGGDYYHPYTGQLDVGWNNDVTGKWSAGFGRGHKITQSKGFAFGGNAHVLHHNSFVFSDDVLSVPFATTKGGQFAVSASGGVRLETGTNATATLNGVPLATKEYVDNAITNNSDGYIGDVGNHSAGGNLDMEAYKLRFAPPSGDAVGEIYTSGGLHLVSEGDIYFEKDGGLELVIGETTVSVMNDLYAYGKIYDSSSSSGNSGQVLSSTGSGTDWIDPPAGSDNLGDHVATNALDMASYKINNVADPALDTDASNLRSVQNEIQAALLNIHPLGGLCMGSYTNRP